MASGTAVAPYCAIHKNYSALLLAFVSKANELVFLSFQAPSETWKPLQNGLLWLRTWPLTLPKFESPQLCNFSRPAYSSVKWEWGNHGCKVQWLAYGIWKNVSNRCYCWGGLLWAYEGKMTFFRGSLTKVEFKGSTSIVSKALQHTWFCDGTNSHKDCSTLA